MKVKSKESNFYRHQVKIKIEGYKIDRLLNQAMSKGIAIRHLKYISSTEITCFVADCDIKSIKKLAKSLYKITLLENRGLEYKIKSFFGVPLRPIGFILVCALVITQSMFVKTIEVRGYRAIPETELLQALEESGIKDGSFIPKIKWDETKEYIYNNFPQVVWIQLVHDGRKILLNIAEGEVTEGVESVKDEDSPRSTLVGETAKKYYCNIIASKSGYIESINCSRGLALVEPGSYVEKGQVLILGCVPLKPTVYTEDMPTEYFVKAKGEVWATVPYRVQFNQERYKTSAAGSDESATVSEGADGDEAAAGSDDTATDNKGTDNHEFLAGEGASVIASKTEKSKKEIEAKLEQQIRLWAKENLPKTAEITNKELNFCYKKNIIEIGVTMEVRQQIGEEQEILIGQKNSDKSGN